MPLRAIQITDLFFILLSLDYFNSSLNMPIQTKRPTKLTKPFINCYWHYNYISIFRLWQRLYTTPQSVCGLIYYGLQIDGIQYCNNVLHGPPTGNCSDPFDVWPRTDNKVVSTCSMVCGSCFQLGNEHLIQYHTATCYAGYIGVQRWQFKVCLEADRRFCILTSSTFACIPKWNSFVFMT